MNELLVTFITWATNESRLHANFYTHAPTEHVARKTNAKVVGQIHHVWREGQKEPFDFHKKPIDVF